MSDRPSQPDSGPSRKFVPAVKPLEKRVLLSSADHSVFAVPQLLAPKHGGIAVQSGTLLSVTVNRPATNTVQVADDGKGDVQVEWNSGAVNSFSGVDTVQVHTEKSRRDQVTFSLTDSSITVPAVAVTPRGSIETTPTPDDRSYPFVQAKIPTPPKHGGVAVQTGTVLTVTVNLPTINTVQITDTSAGSIEVAWNGGLVHSFTGVSTIVVDAQRARNDRITFSEPAQ